MREGSNKKIVTKTIEEYASSTSIHGIGYIFDREIFVTNLILEILSQKAQLGGPLVVDGGRACLHCACHSPHLEHLDPVAREPGEYLSIFIFTCCTQHLGGDHFEGHGQASY